MANLADVFDPDEFGLVHLTDAVNKIPAQPTTIAQLGIFEGEPTSQTKVAVEEFRGRLFLVPTTKRMGPGVQSPPEKRAIVALNVPHIQVDDSLGADDVLNVRRLGGTDTEAVGSVVERKLALMRRSVDVTNEYLRWGALNGLVTYPTNSVDANVNLYTVFEDNSEQNVEFTLDTATTDVVESIIPEVFDKIETALGGTPFTGVYALVGRSFFRKLIAHDRVRDLYEQQSARLMEAFMGQVDMPRMNRRRVALGGMVFEEYHGVVSGTTFPTTTQGRAFPIGAGIFKSFWAPADLPEVVGTLGEPLYARQYSSPDGKMVNLEVQSNPLHICTRPQACIKLYEHTA